MAKYKMYTLYAKLEGSSSEKYNIFEALKQDNKRGQELMSAADIEELDAMTSEYETFSDINETLKTIYNSERNLHSPVIFVDKDMTRRTDSYYIFDVVYASDAIELDKKNRSNIKIWLAEYLKSNPNSVNEFRVINEIFENVKNKYRYKKIEDCIDIAIAIYFETENYKRYREAYFTLKKLDPQRVKKHGQHQ